MDRNAAAFCEAVHKEPGKFGGISTEVHPSALHAATAPHRHWTMQTLLKDCRRRSLTTSRCRRWWPHKVFH